MALKIIRGPEQAPIAPLIGRTVAVIGYGNQGAAHALNLRESGIHVVVGARSGSAGAERARQQNFSTMSIAEASSQADLVVIALPDEVQPIVHRECIAPNLKAGAIVGFLHGFNIRYGFISASPETGVIMVAPKGPGTTLRERYLQGQGIPCLFAVHQDSAKGDAEAIGLAWASGIGCARAGIIYTTCQNETEADLFGEQSVLCGGMTALILAGFETLVEAGYPPELAYLECCHEVKQIADLVYAKGLAGMMESISNTAEFGAYQVGPQIVDENVRRRLRDVLSRIQGGDFARDLQHDHAREFEWFNHQREQLKRHPIEHASKTIRSLMPWLASESSIVNRQS